MTINVIELSVVIPVFNEDKTIKETCIRLRSILSKVVKNFEILVVDDGSTDDTVLVLKSLLEEIEELRVIKLHLNRGHMVAINVGLRHSRGKATAIIDADLQDPPDALVEMYELIKSSASTRDPVFIVEAQRINRSTDTRFKRVTARLYYRFVRILTGIKITSNVADYKMMRREVVEVLSQVSEEEILRVLIPSLGFPTRTISIERSERLAGESKYNLRKMFSLALDSIVDYSVLPIKIATRVAVLISLFSLLGIIWVVATYVFAETAVGWSSIIALLLLLNGMLFGFISLVCLYLTKIYLAQKERPKPFVSEIFSLKNNECA